MKDARSPVIQQKRDQDAKLKALYQPITKLPSSILDLSKESKPMAPRAKQSNMNMMDESMNNQMLDISNTSFMVSRLGQHQKKETKKKKRA